MRADLDHRMTDEISAKHRCRVPSTTTSATRTTDENNTVGWQRFREAVASWDAAQPPPGSLVQDPFNNLPPGYDPPPVVRVRMSPIGFDTGSVEDPSVVCRANRISTLARCWPELYRGVRWWPVRDRPDERS